MKNILVVADEGQAGEVVINLLSSVGFRGISESIGISALHCLASDKPVDLVIIDWGAWNVEMNNALQYVRKVDPRVPVLVMTEWCSIEQYIHTMSLGACEYLVKPVADHDLMRSVRFAVGSTSKHEQAQEAGVFNH